MAINVSQTQAGLPRKSAAKKEIRVSIGRPQAIAATSEGANFIKVHQCFGQSAAAGPMEGAANADGRRRSTVINRLHTTPRMTIRALPTPQTAQTVTDSPPAKAAGWLRAASMAGLEADSIEVNARVSSGGIQGASQSGAREPSIAPEPSARTPAFETVHAAIEWNAQTASDQSTRRMSIPDQLSA